MSSNHFLRTDSKTPRFLQGNDTRVSSLSVFSHDIWDFTVEIGDESLANGEKVIAWRFKVTEESDSLDPIYSTTLLTLKQLAFAMLSQAKPNKCVTVVRTIARLKSFIRYLAQRPTPIYRFQDVLESDLKSYIDHLKEQPANEQLSPQTLSRYFQILNKLFDFRDNLIDPLRFRPTGNLTPTKITGGERKIRVGTQAIPDDELKALVELVINYIEVQSPRMFKCLKDYKTFSKGVDFSKFKSPEKARYIERHFFSGREDFQSGPALNSALIHLRTACLIMVAFSTGMRISEILATRRGCIRAVPEQNHGLFYWLDSKLFKTQKKNSGSARSWMCGSLAATAVSVMEELGELLGAQKTTQHLFIAFNHFGLVERTKITWMIKCLSVRKAGADVKDFCAFHKLNPNIHMHQFRRSFARNIVRYSSTSILALKDHFKHWSLYMTDWYVGIDANLLEELEAERLLLSIEAMEKICTQTVSGTGGRRWTQELEHRMADGKLPKNFRGKAGAEFRKKMIAGLHDSGMIVIPCGSFTFCVFQKDRALCTKGERPSINRCNPFECLNSYILLEHAPFYRRKLADVESLYSALGERERASPVGLFYLQEIKKLRKGLEPFTYNEHTAEK